MLPSHQHVWGQNPERENAQWNMALPTWVVSLFTKFMRGGTSNFSFFLSGKRCGGKYVALLFLVSPNNESSSISHTSYFPCVGTKRISRVPAGGYLPSPEPQPAQHVPRLQGCEPWLPPSPVHEVQDDARSPRRHPGAPGRRAHFALLHFTGNYRDSQGGHRYGHTL